MKGPEAQPPNPENVQLGSLIPDGPFRCQSAPSTEVSATRPYEAEQGNEVRPVTPPL
jgi:hypothetical protein